MAEWDVPGDSWEERMAARAAQRRVVAEAERITREEGALTELAARHGWNWLNGWPREGDTVLIGTVVCCVGCGRHYGLTCVVFPEDWEPPGPEPRWPYSLDDCPICRA